jgi:micrococcal nuclease
MKFQLQQIKDGDTLVVNKANLEEIVRLYGIDCPELAQKPYGELARKRISELLIPQTQIEVITIERDVYNRLVGEVWVDDICINTQLLSEGYAVAYRRHLRGEYRQRYLKAEGIARQQRRQIWSQPILELPWHYPQNHRHPRN